MEGTPNQLGFLGAVFVSLCLPACFTPDQVIVHISADAVSQARAASVLVRVDTLDDPARFRQELTVGSEPLTRTEPLDITVVPAAGTGDHAFRVRVALRDESARIYNERTAIVTFHPLAVPAREVWIHLQDECQGESCRGAQTCQRGTAEEPECVDGCVDAAGVGTTTVSPPHECVDGCDFRDDGESCNGRSGRCWEGACCTGCWNGTVCVADEDMWQGGEGGGDYGIQGQQCVQCECAGDLPGDDGRCKPAFEAVALEAGQHHACASFADPGGGSARRLVCWGSNAAGQLGTTPSSPREPTVVSETTLVLSLGQDHSCGVAVHDGDEPKNMRCWGAGNAGMLGTGDRRARIDIEDVSVVSPEDDVSGFRSTRSGLVATGRRHTCRATAMGVYCWGSNEQGQLGTGGSGGGESSEPVRVLGGNATSIDAGARLTCAVVDHQLLCWGADDTGATGRTDSLRATPMPPLSLSADPELRSLRWDRVAVGTFGACAIDSEGHTYCWGDIYTDLVQGADARDGWDERHHRMHPLPPVVAASQDSYSQIDLGLHHMCGVLHDGSLVCMGKTEGGELGGEGDVVHTRSVGLPWAEVATGEDFTCARRGDRTIWCWGQNDQLQLGDVAHGRSSTVPRRVCPPVGSP